MRGGAGGRKSENAVKSSTDKEYYALILLNMEAAHNMSREKNKIVRIQSGHGVCAWYARNKTQRYQTKEERPVTESKTGASVVRDV